MLTSQSDQMNLGLAKMQTDFHNLVAYYIFPMQQILRSIRIKHGLQLLLQSTMESKSKGCVLEGANFFIAVLK